jgi:uncharacterized lipoprotein YajG
MRKYALLAMLILLAACSTPSMVLPFSFPLRYQTMASPGEFPALGSCAALSAVRVDDAREEKTVGKRFIEGKNAPPAPVTVSTDVAEWVRAGAESALTRSGGSIGTADAPTLHIRVEGLTTNENVLHRAGYDGRITLSAELTAKGAGAPCWNGHAEGFSENYGYAASVENYQETVNHALDRAMIGLLSDPELKKAICDCGSGG